MRRRISRATWLGHADQLISEFKSYGINVIVEDLAHIRRVIFIDVRAGVSAVSFMCLPAQLSGLVGFVRHDSSFGVAYALRPYGGLGEPGDAPSFPHKGGEA